MRTVIWGVAAAAIVFFSQSMHAQTQSAEINRQHSDALNAMSKAAGGRGYILNVEVIDAAAGREVQMSVMDRLKRRWTFGVDHGSSEPRTRIAVQEDGTLSIVADAAEPRFGIVNGEPLGTPVGQAINAEFAKVAKSQAAARIRTIRVPTPATFVVTWESSTGEKGTFSVKR